VRVLIPVVKRDKFYRPHEGPGLLAYLSSCGLGGRLTDVGPAARERPEVVFFLFYEQDLAVAVHHHPGSPLRGCGPASRAKRFRTAIIYLTQGESLRVPASKR
jgi:hypothetical protein